MKDRHGVLLSCLFVFSFVFFHHTIVLPQLQVSNNYQKVWVWYFMQLLIAPPPSHVNGHGQGGSQDSKQAGVGKNGKSV